MEVRNADVSEFLAFVGVATVRWCCQERLQAKILCFRTRKFWFVKAVNVLKEQKMASISQLFKIRFVKLGNTLAQELEDQCHLANRRS